MEECDIVISSEPSHLDVELIHRFLNETYWASGRSRDQVQRTIDRCRCYGVFRNGQQIAFARVLSDFVTFAYVMDVFVLPEFRRQKIATRLMLHVLDDDELRDVTVWQLKTRDAHELYRNVGFELVDESDVENLMRLHRDSDCSQGRT